MATVGCQRVNRGYHDAGIAPTAEVPTTSCRRGVDRLFASWRSPSSARIGRAGRRRGSCSCHSPWHPSSPSPCRVRVGVRVRVGARVRVEVRARVGVGVGLRVGLRVRG
eukprot:scaffold56167_cov63-Phaeocystis_antarctica.AAC.3